MGFWESMTIYGRVSLVVVIGLPLVLVGHYVLSAARVVLRVEPHRRLRMFERVLYLVAAGSAVVLCVTALGSVIVYGHMRGWMLLIHLGAAGAFAVSLPLAGLMWAGAHRMGRAIVMDGRVTGGLRFLPLARLSFWVWLIAGTVSLASMVAVMVGPLSQQESGLVFDIHRYSGLVVFAAVTTHLYSLWVGRRERRGRAATG